MPEPGQRNTAKAASSDESDALYALPLDQFVSERNELACRLRRDHRPEDAARVAKLTKPAVAAWAANQALRSQPAAARELRAAGKALADAQTAALSDRANRGDLREASERHRVALQRLVDAARGLLDSRGHALSPATVERVAQTLNAASLDPSLAQEGEEARLEREHFYTGLDELAPTAETRPARPKRARSTPKRTGNASRAATARERREREATRKRRAAQIKAAQNRVSEARKRTAPAAKARDAAARAAKSASAEHRRAEQRHAKALEEQVNAQAKLEAIQQESD